MKWLKDVLTAKNRRLFLAVEGNDVKRLEALLRKGVNPDERGQNGGTALHLAASLGNSEIVDLLLSKAASPTCTDDAGGTAIDLALDKAFFSIASTILHSGGTFHSEH